MKKKVLVFHPAIAPYRIDLFNSLNKSFEAEFCFFRRNLLSQKFNEDVLLSQLDFEPHYLTKGFDLNSKGQMIRFGVINKLINFKPEIVLCSEFGLLSIYIAIIAKFINKKTKVYSICDDSLDVAVNSGFIRRTARIIAMCFFDGLILANELSNKWYNEKFPKTKTVVFPIIQHEDRIRRISDRSLIHVPKFVSEFKLNDKKVFLFIGRLVEVKNLFFLINVFAKYSKKESAAVLVLVGDGILKNELIEHTKKLGIENRVVFPGRYENEELFAWYNIADYFVLPSISEPFGAVVNESLVMGVPVFCSELAGASCLINDDNGDLFDPYDEEKLLYLFETVSLKSKTCVSTKTESLMPYSFTERYLMLETYLKK